MMMKFIIQQRCHRWEDGGWQHYELDLKTWIFEEESFVPMALLYHGKAYSIVTDQLGTPTEVYNDEGEEVWSRRLDMNGNILEENYDRYAPYSEQIRIPFLFQGSTTTTKQNSLTTDSATTRLN